MAVDVAEAVADVLDPDCVEVIDAVADELDPEPELPLESLAPQTFGLDPAGPRVDLR